ncbi:DUF397 domain-containing protein [Streptomyces scopuliridis]|uniref:DUF397 domain-containing protein n=1 Tax=Streptomyces scopuliridis TaxID=452529 RepID=UPI002DDA668C|nr:DUF397 domain-containing protein [Streptomyces scopuliridis]WSB37493.1 DUF397 domain-containing protein [Streptomyces scopuliridis]
MTHKPVSPPPSATGGWFKSSYSGGEGSSCVEVADFSSTIGVRDSKDRDLPRLSVSKQAWSAFIEMARSRH